ncbi:MAG: VTT domain-containing protein [Patescibacteria group bacterium]|nr:VTT domain-containing protein [Patescibacteria group bacterium]
MLIDLRILIQGLATGDPTSYISVFLLLVLNEVGIPLPIVYETLLLITGYSLAQGRFAYLFTVVFGSFGSVVGASLVFFFFYIFGPEILDSRLLRRFHAKVNLLKELISQREITDVALGRLTPGLVGLTSVASGLLRLNYFKFVLGILVSNLVWAAILISLGFFLGQTSERFSGQITLLVGFFSLIVFVFTAKRIVARLRSRPTPPIVSGEAQKPINEQNI